MYSDGSFDGVKEAVRKMHAGREGELSAIRFWAALFAKPQEAGAESLIALGEGRVKEDRAYLEDCRASATDEAATVLCFYRSGLLHADMEISDGLGRPPKAASDPWAIDNFVRSWLQKFEKDKAMIECSRSFLAISIK
jgi:hypothetical protein